MMQSHFAVVVVVTAAFFCLQFTHNTVFVKGAACFQQQCKIYSRSTSFIKTDSISTRRIGSIIGTSFGLSQPQQQQQVDDDTTAVVYSNYDSNKENHEKDDERHAKLATSSKMSAVLATEGGIASSTIKYPSLSSVLQIITSVTVVLLLQQSSFACDGMIPEKSLLLSSSSSCTDVTSSSKQNNQYRNNIVALLSSFQFINTNMITTVIADANDNDDPFNNPAFASRINEIASSSSSSSTRGVASGSTSTSSFFNKNQQQVPTQSTESIVPPTELSDMEQALNQMKSKKTINPRTHG